MGSCDFGTDQTTGQTPAYEVCHWGQIHYGEYPLKSPLPDPPDDFETTGFTSTLGPGIVATKTHFFGPELTIEQTADLKAGNSAIYVFG